MDETYTAKQLRRDAIAIERMHGETLTVEWRGHQASQLRAHADALEELATLREQLAERDAEIVALKAHAEAMAERLDAWARIDECKCSEVDAYRRDFPKEEK